LKRWYGQKEIKTYDIVLLQLAVIVMSHLTNNPTKSCPEINPTTKEKNTRSPGQREKERRKLDCHFKCLRRNLRLETQIVFLSLRHIKISFQTKNNKYIYKHALISQNYSFAS
jgi:hypothetical protein